ncbi:hypothetical protein [Candidatus Methylomicrobium oryzae]|uniref:hypothetical protein n=1 Tax=Candidatus Methylomicrobium oryzae TaxID=2802053 RepID=UPI001922F2BF|nr:hypothetical protein [Methylomicrobium sp. RS1]MBL1263297.1 hypothetical protein [Methylomicrobium sp. RS1]
MKAMPSKSRTALKGLIEINFYVSVAVLIAGCVLSISEDASLFEFNVDLYGPLANNLRMILVYLALTEVFLCIGCFLLGKTQFFILIGLSLVLMIGSLEVYGMINGIEVDPDLSTFFAYTGLSHIAFGLSAYFSNEKNINAKAKPY